MRKNLIGIPLIVLVLLLATTAAVVAGVGEPRQGPPGDPDARPAEDAYVDERPSPGDRPESESVGGKKVAALRDQMAVLRRAPTADDKVDEQVANSPILADGIADLQAARRVRRPGKPVWIAPSSNGEAVCQIAAGELNCPLVADIEDDGAAVAIFWHAEGPIRVSGIVSDEVEDVTVLAKDGSTRSVSVVDNQFLFESERAPSEVRWTSQDGREEHILPDIPGR